RIRFLICEAVRDGFCALSRPTRPVTCGVAIDVPLSRPYWLLGSELRMFSPGAPMSTVVAPKLLKNARWSKWLVARTEMMLLLGYVAGKNANASLSELALPAAATNSMPACWCAVIASCSAWEKPPPPHELFVATMSTGLFGRVFKVRK